MIPPPFDVEERKRLWACGPVNHQFPVKIRGKTWERISGQCGDCKACVADDDLHGEVIHTFDGIARVMAVCICRKCEVCTCFDIHLKETSASGFDSNGNWNTWQYVPTILGRIKTFFRKLFT